MSETFAATAWLLTQLRTLGAPVHERPAPESTPTPFIGYSIEPEPHVSFVEGRIAMARCEVLVAVVGKQSPASIRELVEGVRDVLHRQEGERDGIYIASREISPFRLPRYFLSGVPYFEIGARYRVLLSKIPEAATVSP